MDFELYNLQNFYILWQSQCKTSRQKPYKSVIKQISQISKIYTKILENCRLPFFQHKISCIYHPRNYYIHGVICYVTVPCIQQSNKCLLIMLTIRASNAPITIENFLLLNKLYVEVLLSVNLGYRDFFLKRYPQHAIYIREKLETYTCPLIKESVTLQNTYSHTFTCNVFLKIWTSYKDMNVIWGFCYQQANNLSNLNYFQCVLGKKKSLKIYFQHFLDVP